MAAFDFRAHGDNQNVSFVEDSDSVIDYSVKVLVDETIAAIKYLAKTFPENTIILVGHSMGGAIATKTAAELESNYKDEDWAKHVQGLIVIDVVEKTALDALPFMENIV